MGIGEFYELPDFHGEKCHNVLKLTPIILKYFMLTTHSMKKHP